MLEFAVLIVAGIIGLFFGICIGRYEIRSPKYVLADEEDEFTIRAIHEKVWIIYEDKLAECIIVSIYFKVSEEVNVTLTYKLEVPPDMHNLEGRKCIDVRSYKVFSTKEELLKSL